MHVILVVHTYIPDRPFLDSAASVARLKFKKNADLLILRRSNCKRYGREAVSHCPDR